MNISSSELTSEQQRLFAEMLAQEGLGDSAASVISRRDSAVAPLSYEQQRLWFLKQFGGPESVYNIPLAVLVKGPLDIQILERALSEIVRRHEVLRTSFGVNNGVPYQQVQSASPVHVALVSLSEQAAPARNDELARLVYESTQQPLDLQAGLLIKATLFRVAAEEHVLVIVMHHIASDGWSLSIFANELEELYRAYSSQLPSPLPELVIQYADYAAWQRESAGDVLAPKLAYWKKQLQGVEVLELPFDRPRPAQMSYRGALFEFTLPADVTRKLNELSQREGATLFMCLLAIFQTFLYRYCGQQDICVGSPVAGRTSKEVEGIIGFFVNTLVLRAQLHEDLSFRELLQLVRQVTLDAYENQEAPFEKLVQELQPHRDMGHTPLFQVMFALQNYEQGDLKLPGLEVTNYQYCVNANAKFDLALVIVESETELQGEVEYSTDLFDADTIANMVRSFKTLTSQVAEAGDGKLSQLSLTDEPKHAGWSSQAEEVEGRTILSSFAQHVLQSPDSPALALPGTDLTYGELNLQSDRVASGLIALGAGHGQRIAICVENPGDAIAAMLGVLKTGGAVVPLEPSDPMLRLASGLQQSGARWLITESAFSEAAIPSSVTYISLHQMLQAEAANGSTPAPDPQADSLAVVAMQSGPGSPRGVLLRHSALVRGGFNSDLDLTSSDRIGLCLNFAAESWMEVFRMLEAGCCLVPIPSSYLAAPRKLAGMLRDQSITVLFTSTALLERLGREFPWALNTVRLIICEDGPANLAHLRQVLDKNLLGKVYGRYGTSETGGRILLWPLAESTIKLEHLCAGATLYLLDHSLQQAPVGAVGEIYVGGKTLSRGYDWNPETSCSFVLANVPEGRLYRTGDRARRRKDGSIEFLGHSDCCVSLRGMRIDLREIETALVMHPAVKTAAVSLHAASRGRAGSLLALIEADHEQSASVEPFAAFLQRHLPGIMIPQKFIEVDDIPMKLCGDVDRAAVARLIARLESEAASIPPYVAPRNVTEEKLAQVWAKVLEAEQVGVNDDFFRLGGHSLLATQLIAVMNEAFGIELPLRRLFEAPNIAEIAPVIGALQSEREAYAIPAITRVSREKYRSAVVPS